MWIVIIEARYSPGFIADKNRLYVTAIANAVLSHPFCLTQEGVKLYHNPL